MDIDTILSMVSNPTRRRILEALVREPCYPLQLSKQIGVSQQAIMKNLDLLEKNGMVISHQATSNIGPTRAMYTPTTEFTIVIDMRNKMFATNMIEEEEYTQEEELETETVESVRDQLREIDQHIDALEKERLALIRKREQLIGTSMSRVEPDLPYEYRNLMYHLLNRPSIPVEEVVDNCFLGPKDAKNRLIEFAKTMKL